MSRSGAGSSALPAIAFSIAQIAIQSIVLFLTYRLAVHSIGLVLLGVWSVASAAVTFGRIGDLGFGGAMPRLLAARLSPVATGGASAVSSPVLVETAVLSSTLGSLLLVLLIYWPLVLFTASLRPETGRQLILELVAGASLALLFTAMSSTFAACLDGLGRFRLRSLIAISGTVVNIILLALTIRPLGVLALPLALLVQGLWTAGLSWHVLRRELDGLALLPCRWSAVAFRELLAIGKFTQTNSLLIMLFEPMSRVMAGRIGGPEFAALFDLAARLAGNLRLLFSSASQATVPFYAYVRDQSDRTRALYLASSSTIAVLAAAAVAIAAGVSPWLSLLALDNVSGEFLVIFAILLVGSLLSVVGGPGYACAMGAGRVATTTQAFLIQTVVFAVVTLALATRLAHDAVSIAYAAGLGLAGVFLVVRVEPGAGGEGLARGNIVRAVAPVLVALLAGIIVARTCKPGDPQPLLCWLPLLPGVIVADLGLRFHRTLRRWLAEINGFRVGAQPAADDLMATPQ